MPWVLYMGTHLHFSVKVGIGTYSVTLFRLKGWEAPGDKQQGGRRTSFLPFAQEDLPRYLAWSLMPDARLTIKNIRAANIRLQGGHGIASTA